jgi:hypothetical protein
VRQQLARPVPARTEEVDVNLDADLMETSKRLTAQNLERYDRAMIRERFKWEFARRSMAQRLRNDGREKRKWKLN